MTVVLRVSWQEDVTQSSCEIERFKFTGCLEEKFQMAFLHRHLKGLIIFVYRLKDSVSPESGTQHTHRPMG